MARKSNKENKKILSHSFVGQAFEGYSLCFKGCKASLEDVFGKKPIPPSQMTKLLWEYIMNKESNIRR